MTSAPIDDAASASIVVASFDPDIGPEGTPVTITGTVFSGVQSVTFDGVEATEVGVSDTQLRVKVPKDATSGPITVTSPAGTASTPLPFTVVPLEEEPPAEEPLLFGEEPVVGKPQRAEREAAIPEWATSRERGTTASAGRTSSTSRTTSMPSPS